jgi:hypothetical protein
MDDPKNTLPPDPSPDTTLKSIQGGKRGGKRPPPKGPFKRYGRVTREIYDMLAERYLSGERRLIPLSEQCNVGIPTVRKAIDLGWPERGWPALGERAVLYDKLHAEAMMNTNPVRAKDARDWLQMRKDFIEIAAGVRIGLAKAVHILVKNVDAATATELRSQRQVHMEEVLDEKGRITRRIPRTMTVDVQVPPSIYRITDSLSSVASALKVTGMGEIEVLLAKPPAGSFGRRGHKLTGEQIQWMAENNGQLPPGVSLEDLGEA